PCRSSLLCSSSTSVVDGPAAVKRISTSLAFAISGSQTQSGESCPGPTCHEKATRCGGSHFNTVPQSHCAPSTLRSYQRPPTRGSTKIASNGGFPMWCVAG